MQRRVLLLLCLVFAAIACPAQVYNGVTTVTARLVADTTAIVPGKPFRIGLVLEMAPGWHTYWQYAGDAGVPTKIEWTLPDGFAAGPIEWPLPEGILEPGDIQVYAYGGEVMLLQTIRPPDDLAEGTVDLKAKTSWLVCEEVCIPGGEEVSLSLPIAKSAEPDNAALFQKWEAQLPAQEAPPFAMEWMREGDRISGKVEAPDAEELAFYPLPSDEQTVGHPKVAGDADKGFTIEIESSGDAPLRGVIAVLKDGNWQGWWTEAGVAHYPTPASEEASSTSSQPSLLAALLFGFLGGIILNLMPCVLPVISLKIFGFVRQAGQSHRAIFLHGLAFTAGVFAWFLGLGLVIVGLKLSGSEVNWAFQFQNPWFNLTIATVVFIFALNLFGVFEIALPGRATNALAQTGGGEGLGASFFQGVFATLLATPCTGPFLGASLGYAFAQPPLVILLMFASIAFGMALPYLILSAQPAWIKFLPKPGAWMERLKQFMGFPLMAALLWLLFVIGAQRGMEAIIWTGAFLVCLGVACWFYGMASAPTASARGRLTGLLTAAIVAVLGGWIFIGNLFASTKSPGTAAIATEEGGIPWEPYSTAKVDELLAAGKPVFIDFTADWCLTCKYNEKTAINVPAVRERIRELGIVPVKADWTNNNPEITAALKKFNRVGVPFYVYYPAGDAKNPVTFPELITESMVLQKLSAPE